MWACGGKKYIGEIRNTRDRNIEEIMEEEVDEVVVRRVCERKCHKEEVIV